MILCQLASLYLADLFPAQFIITRENRKKRRKENKKRWNSAQGNSRVIHSLLWSQSLNVAPNEHQLLFRLFFKKLPLTSPRPLTPPVRVHGGWVHAPAKVRVESKFAAAALNVTEAPRRDHQNFSLHGSEIFLNSNFFTDICPSSCNSVGLKVTNCRMFSLLQAVKQTNSSCKPVSCDITRGPRHLRTGS